MALFHILKDVAAERVMERREAAAVFLLRFDSRLFAKGCQDKKEDLED